MHHACGMIPYISRTSSPIKSLNGMPHSRKCIRIQAACLLPPRSKARASPKAENVHSEYESCIILTWHNYKAQGAQDMPLLYLQWAPSMHTCMHKVKRPTSRTIWLKVTPCKFKSKTSWTDAGEMQTPFLGVNPETYPISPVLLSPLGMAHA